MGVLVRILSIAALASCAAAQTRLLLATAVSPIVQNARADEDDLSRIADERMLSRFVSSGYLVSVPEGATGYYLKAIPGQYRYARPWTKRFLDQVGREFRSEFGHSLRVTSLVRTGRFQLRLARYNGNAAPATGPTQSSHLTGATVDISKADMSSAERDWMRTKLVSLKDRGYLYGIEERVQPTFHVMVFKNYPAAARRVKAKSSRRR